MAVRWAITYKLKPSLIDSINYDQTTVDKDFDIFDKGRYCLVKPKRAFKTVSKWYSLNTRSDMENAFKFNSSEWKVGPQKRETTHTLLLEGAAIAMNGTTSELQVLLRTMQSHGDYNQVQRISAGKNDFLCIAYARVAKKKTLGVTPPGKETVVIVAPFTSWWTAEGERSPPIKTGKEIFPGGDGEVWRAFKGADFASAPQQQHIDLTILSKLITQGKDMKPWIAVDSVYFN
jgi:hypothetical protein